MAIAQTMSASDIVEKPIVSRISVRRAIAPGPACISSTPKASSIEAVERDVALGQDVLEHVRVAIGRGGRRDHEEPEECAEAEHQDRRVECEAGPLHAQGGRADRGQDGGEERADRSRGRRRRRPRGTGRRRTASRSSSAGCRSCRPRAMAARNAQVRRIAGFGRACQAATVASSAEPTLAGKSENSLKTSKAGPPLAFGEGQQQRDRDIDE